MALGAAYLAGLTVGPWSGIGDIVNNSVTDTIFKPDMDDETRLKALQGWKQAVSAVANQCAAIKNS